jgi:hypothetical protein
MGFEIPVCRFGDLIWEMVIKVNLFMQDHRQSVRNVLNGEDVSDMALDITMLGK